MSFVNYCRSPVTIWFYSTKIYINCNLWIGPFKIDWLKLKTYRPGIVAQQCSASLASARPWVQYPVPKQKNLKTCNTEIIRHYIVGLEVLIVFLWLYPLPSSVCSSPTSMSLIQLLNFWVPLYPNQQIYPSTLTVLALLSKWIHKKFFWGFRETMKLQG